MHMTLVRGILILLALAVLVSPALQPRVAAQSPASDSAQPPECTPKEKVDSPENSGLRHWTRLKGVAADILLDRDTYKVGEDIPLHLAIANFDATAPIFSWDPQWDPCDVVEVQVLDTSGIPLPEQDRFSPPSWSCTGDGFGPRPFEKGKIVSMEWSLKNTGWLPNHPGTYTIVVSWRTSTGSITEPDRKGRVTMSLKPYATVQAKATIHITDSPSPSPSH